MLDGYVRVSRIGARGGDSFISPDVQRDQIIKWAELRGETIAEIHVDLDQSGARQDRPGLQAAIERVEQGVSDGIVVAKLDRFARNLPMALEAIRRVTDAGGQVVAVAEGIDPTTHAGKLLRGLLLLIAEWQLDQIRDNWRIARERAVARGIHVASGAPTGYLRGPDGVLVPHPEHAGVVRRLFEMRAGGASWGEMDRWLAAQQVEGPTGVLNEGSRAARNLVINRVYLGEARSGEFVNTTAHEPLVDRGLWEAANIARPTSAARSSEPALLAGLLRCAGCRHPMKPDRMRLRDGSRVRTYRCRIHHSGGRCQDRAAVIGHRIEPYVEAALLGHLADMEAHAHQDNAELTRLETVVGELEADLAVYRDDERILGAIGPDRYVSGLQARAQRLERAHSDLAQHRARLTLADVSAVELAALWPDLSVERRRRVLAGAVDAVMLRSGRQLAIEDRAHIFWRGEAPGDLPRRGLTRQPIRPFLWPAD